MLLLFSACLVPAAGAAPLPHLSVTQQNGVPLHLHALGGYEPEGRLLFMAAIYMTPSAASFTDNNSRRLEMRFNTDDSAFGGVTRLWLDGIAANSSRTQRSHLQASIDRLASYFRRPIRPGDRLVFDYIAIEQRTIVYYNDTALGSIPGREMFELMLQAWIGPNPVDAPMKAALLACLDGEIPESDVRRFRLIPFESRPQNTLRSVIPD